MRVNRIHKTDIPGPGNGLTGDMEACYGKLARTYAAPAALWGGEKISRREGSQNKLRGFIDV